MVNRIVLVLVLSVCMVFLSTCEGSRSAAGKLADEPATADNIESFFSRGDYEGAAELAGRRLEEEKILDSQISLWYFLSLIQTGKTEEAESLLDGIREEVQLDKTDLLEPIRFIDEKKDPDEYLRVYSSFLTHISVTNGETADLLRFLEAVRIIIQRYGSAEWLSVEVRNGLSDLEERLEMSFSNTTPLGAVRSKVE